MGVDQHHREHQSPSLSETDYREQVARIMNTVRATISTPPGRLDAPGEDHDVSGLPGGRGTSRPIEQWISPEKLRQQMAEHQPRAEQGDPGSARRMAELHEALHEFDTADAWWHVAAKLGDEDAQDHVEYNLT